MIVSKSSSDDINIAVRKVYNMCTSSVVKSGGIYAEFDSVMRGSYNSDNFYYGFPRNIIFKVTSNCNLRCKHCFFYGNEQNYDCKDELVDNEKIKLIKYFCEEVNIMHCTLTGGEIFTSSVIFDLIKILKKHNIPLDMLTNGILIDENLVMKLNKYLDKNYDLFQISIDGANAATNDLIRGTGTFDKAINAVKLLKKHGFSVLIAFTINSQNVSELPKMYQLCKELNVDRLNVGRMISLNTSQQKLIATNEEIILSAAKLYDIYDNSIKMKFKALKTHDFLEFEEGRKILDNKLLQNNVSPPCSLHCTPHHDQAAIFPNGNISLCYDCDKPKFSIGNIKDQPFEIIWKNRFSSILFQDRLIQNSSCKYCKYIAFCNTGCIFRAYEMNGTINSPGVNCKYYKNYIKQRIGD